MISQLGSSRWPRLLTAGVCSLLITGVAAAPSLAAGKGGAAGPQAAPALNPLYMDTNNSATATTSFFSSGGSWNFLSSVSNSYGLHGQSPDKGVYGLAINPDGIGVWGEDSQLKGIGVLGLNQGYADGKPQTPAFPFTPPHFPDGGVGVFGVVDAATTNNATGGYGVVGLSANPSGYGGVFSATNTSGVGVLASGNSYGVYGKSTGNYGVVGVSTNFAAVRAIGTNSYGIWASSSAGGIGGYFSTGTGTVALKAKNPTASPGYYAIVAEGNVTVTGTLHATGGVSAPVATAQGDRLVYAEQATRNLLTDQGTAQLVGGYARITLDPLYAQTVNLSEDYQVFLTPNSADTAGLAVVNKTATGFEVRELAKGKGSFRFDWRISAARKGYEKARLAPAPAAAPTINEPYEAPATP